MSSSEHSTTLFRNVRVFDGRSSVLSNGSNVLVRGSTIESISPQSIDPGHIEHRVEIDGGGRVLMPGLIDAHWHAMLASMPIAAMRTADIGYLNLVAGEQATRTLHRGFTTVRDAGGPSFGLKRDRVLARFCPAVMQVVSRDVISLLSQLRVIFSTVLGCALRRIHR
jgi:imidazolonepropionase-like amidohydrolase